MNPEYVRYMRSREWQEKRKQVLRRDGYKCLMCDAIEQGIYNKEDLEVHHRHYKNFTCEPLDDLSTVCPACHHAITSVHRERRYLSRGTPEFNVVDTPTVARSQEADRAIPERKPVEDVNPKAKTKETRNGLENTSRQTQSRITNPHAQWANRRSIKSILKSDEESVIEKKQDRS